MTKYYYTDPLKAAWMAREFGVKFDISPDMNGHSYDEIMVHMGNLYIHPDFYHVFEPKDGDMDCDGYIYYSQNKAWYDKDANFCEANESFPIWRNNKAFFMPEQEE